MKFLKAFDKRAGIDYIKNMENGSHSRKGKDVAKKQRNPFARAVRENKIFTERVVSVKVRYIRKVKHKGKGESNGYD